MAVLLYESGTVSADGLTVTIEWMASAPVTIGIPSFDAVVDPGPPVRPYLATVAALPSKLTEYTNANGVVSVVFTGNGGIRATYDITENILQGQYVNFSCAAGQVLDDNGNTVEATDEQIINNSTVAAVPTTTTHYNLEAVGEMLNLADHSHRVTMFCCGDSNETHGHTGVDYHGNRAAYSNAAHDDHNIPLWCVGPMCRPSSGGLGGQGQTVYGDPVTSPDDTPGPGIGDEITGGIYDDYLRGVSTNSGNYYIASGVSLVLNNQVGWRGKARNHATVQVPDAYDLGPHSVSFWYRYYGVSANTGAKLQFKIRESGGTESNHTGSEYLIDADDSIHFVRDIILTAGQLNWDSQSSLFKWHSIAATGEAAWSDFYHTLDDVTNGLHISPLWNKGGGVSDDCYQELTQGSTPANDLFLQQRFIETAALQGVAIGDMKGIFRYAIGGNDWGNNSASEAAQELWRGSFKFRAVEVIDHFKETWVAAGGDLENLAIWLEGYHDAGAISTNNPGDYGYRSTLREIAVEGGPKYTFTDPASIFNAVDMNGLGHYANLSPNWDSHRSPEGYNAVISESIRLMTAAAHAAEDTSGIGTAASKVKKMEL